MGTWMLGASFNYEALLRTLVIVTTASSL